MQLYLVRHGETAHGLMDLLPTGLDPGLSDAGKNRLEELSKTLEQDFDLVLASPLKRAVQSAEILAKTLGGEVKVENILKQTDPEALRDFFEHLKTEGHTKVLAVTHYVVIDPFYGLFPSQQRKEIKHGSVHIFEI